MHVFDELFESSAPALMTVSEASRVLRIGRQLAYDLANEYLASNGASGLPVLRLGRKNLRVPTWALAELVETGRVVQLCANRSQVGDVNEL